MPGWIRFEAAHRLPGELHPALEAPPDGTWGDGMPQPGRDWHADGIEVLETADGVTAAAPGRDLVRAIVERRPGERFGGFGIRSDQAIRDRGEVENWVGEGPYQLAEYPLIGAITPRWAIRQRRDAAYYVVPWALGTRGRAVLILNSEYSRFELQETRLVAEVRAPRLELMVVEADSMAAALERLTRATGRQPAPAAPWFFGPWLQTGHRNLVAYEDEARIVEAAGDSIVAVETHMRRLPGGAHESHRESERRRTALFRDHGLASLTYLNPFVSEDYERRIERARPLLQRTGDGEPYMFDAYIGDREPPITREGQLDFTNPGAEPFFEELAREALDDGHLGWMEDFGEYTPPDAHLHDGGTGEQAHNRYPTDFHAAAARATLKAAGPGVAVARMGRSGWTGTAPHLPLVWGGDPTTGWGFDGLASAVVQGLNAGLSGVAFWGSDIGGFFTLGDQELDAELLIRWIQFGAFTPLMRTKAEGIAIPPRARPQVWEPEILPHWRRWARTHIELLPYLSAAAREYVATGMPLMRHLALEHGPDYAHVEDQYMLGPDLLVAPVLEPGARRRKVEVPPGEWHSRWHPELRYRGPATVEVDAPIDEIPVLHKA